MAAPRLPVTAQASTYAPYSLTAVLAVAVAGLFLVFLLAVSATAFLTGQPFIQPMLLAFPTIALVLAFAARRQILSSEGTRAGLNLCTIAWWIAVLGGLGYAAYLAAVAFAIRRDAAGQFEAWAVNVAEADPTDLRNAAFYRAYHATLEPARQDSLRPTEIDRILKERRDEVQHFRHCDIIRLAFRNHGATTFSAAGLQTWEQDSQQGLSCTLAGQMKTPEGEFGLTVPMLRQPVNGKPTWQIKQAPSGYVQSARVTRYGQLVHEVEQSGVAYGYMGLLPVLSTHGANPAALTGVKQPGEAAALREKLDREAFARTGALGGIGFLLPEPADADRFVTQNLFTPTDPSQADSARRRFLQCVRSGRMSPPGMLSQSQSGANTAPLLRITDKQVEMRLPVELQVSTNEMPCRGILVIACNDPAMLARLNELRQAAASDTLSEYQTGTALKLPWEVVRFESEMRPMPQPRQAGPGGDMPGMPGEL